MYIIMKTTIICQPYLKKFTEYPDFHRNCNKFLINSAKDDGESHQKEEKEMFGGGFGTPLEYFYLHERFSFRD